MYDVAIIGSGFSAIVEAIYLLQRLPASATIAVVGDDPGFGRGTAYRTEFQAHRLNVPAGRMSVFNDRPDDFEKWLGERESGLPTDGFASRSDFGRYLRDCLANLLRTRQTRASLFFIKGKAVSCERCDADKVVFKLSGGSTLAAHHVVLCLGIGSASISVDPRVSTEFGASRLIHNPWRLGWLSRVASADSVCILGTGLTMIDQILALKVHGHNGKLFALSRRGLVPHAHLSEPIDRVAPQLPNSREISDLLHSLRMQVRNGVEWHSLMDGLRPMTQRLWAELSLDQRSRFLRHALAWWNIHRHRLAPEVSRDMHRLMSDGMATIHAGYLKSIDEREDGFSVKFRKRGGNTQVTLNVDWIVNCTGMERAGIGHSRLFRQMQNDGMILPDELGLGLTVDENAQIVSSNTHGHASLYAVGALTAGRFWEITAVPDIRVQAENIATRIANQLAGTCVTATSTCAS